MNSLRTVARLVSALGLVQVVGEKVKRSAESAALASLAGVLFLIGLVFLLALAFRLLEQAFGPEAALAIFGVAFLVLGGIVLIVRARRQRPVVSPVDPTRVEAGLREGARQLALPAIASAAFVAFLAARSFGRGREE